MQTCCLLFLANFMPSSWAEVYTTSLTTACHFERRQSMLFLKSESSILVDTLASFQRANAELSEHLLVRAPRVPGDGIQSLFCVPGEGGGGLCASQAASRFL